MKKSAGKTKTKVKQVLNQAKDQAKASLKILEMLEKDTLAKAKTAAILATLKKIGVSSADDVESLRLRIERLEAEVATLREGRESENIPRA